MKEITSYCGLNCDTCEAAVATRTDDNRLREKLAARWSRLYGFPVKPEQVNCTGCKGEGPGSPYCETLCRVKTCCEKRGLETCASCGLFACEAIGEILDFSEEARARLHELRERCHDHTEGNH